MIKGILWDVDDVLRRYQSFVFGHVPSTWLEEDDPEWQRALKLVKGNPKHFLAEAPHYSETVDYILANFKKGEVNILTCQGGEESLEEATKEFLVRVFGFEPNIIFVKDFEEKLQVLRDNPDTVLVDDYPRFVEHPDFESEFRARIILFDQPNNRGVKPKYRLSCSRQDLKVFDKDKSRKYDIVTIHNNLLNGVHAD